MTVELLLSELRSEQRMSQNSFNPYMDEVLLKNLEIYLNLLKDRTAKYLLVGEALGYKGARLTGIPFTSQNVINESAHPLVSELRKRGLKINGNQSENSAQIFWNTLSEFKDSTPIFWNAYPFHPFKCVENIILNRKPAKGDLEVGKKYLQMIVAIYKPIKIAAVGRVSESLMKEMFHENVVYLRHPSYGGRTDFQHGIREFLR